MLDLHQNWECDGRSAGSVDVIPLCSYGVVNFFCKFFGWAELLDGKHAYGKFDYSTLSK